MKKYLITTGVNTKLMKAEDVIWGGAAKAIPLLHAMPIGGLGALAPFAMIAVGKALKDNSITKISSLEQLGKYKNCISSEWKNNVIYVEHPHRKNVLIEASLYKDYILREMVADIANYISDNLNLSKLVIGLISSGRINAKGNVPVQDINVEATIKCNLDKNYIYSVCDTYAMNDNEAEYVWTGLFPDIISAVDHKAGKMEIRKKVSLDLDVHAGIGKAIAGVLGGQRDYEFYITYIKAKDN